MRNYWSTLRFLFHYKTWNDDSIRQHALLIRQSKGHLSLFYASIKMFFHFHNQSHQNSFVQQQRRVSIGPLGLPHPWPIYEMHPRPDFDPTRPTGFLLLWRCKTGHEGFLKWNIRNTQFSFKKKPLVLYHRF